MLYIYLPIFLCYDECLQQTEPLCLYIQQNHDVYNIVWIQYTENFSLMYFNTVRSIDTFSYMTDREYHRE